MACDGELERPAWLSGQLLTASDLQAEQQYFLARFRRHNRYLHGWGVVRGLEVTVTGATEIVVEPGLAIDCAGNEIVVCDSSAAQISGRADTYFVTLEYAETPTSPVPGLGTPPAAGTDELVFTRVREGFRLGVSADDPTTGHRGKGTGTPGCGLPHPLCIARIRRIRRGWRVESRGRRRTGRRS